MTRFPSFREDGSGLVSARFRGDQVAIGDAVHRWFDEEPIRREVLVGDAGSLPRLVTRHDQVALVQSVRRSSRLWLGYLVYLVKFVEEETDAIFEGFWDEVTEQPHSSLRPDDGHAE